jgi:uncharacterized protein YecE (DUF72 family)
MLPEDCSGSRQSVRVGCAGWSIPRQAASQFLGAGSHLNRYSEFFNCCEINSSFYRSHKPETWERWVSSVGSVFRFSVKLPKIITHVAKLSCDSCALSTFFDEVTFLRDKLGPVLIQLSPSLEFENGRLHTFLSMLRNIYPGPVVLEPRHSSWFEDQVDFLLQDFRVARVAADPPCVPKAGMPGGYTRLVYFRMHGSPRRYYSAYRSDFLINLAAQLASLGRTAEVWCIFDNTASGYAIENAGQLISKLRRLPRSEDRAKVKRGL